jgi:hypothetical protein
MWGPLVLAGDLGARRDGRGGPSAGSGQGGPGGGAAAVPVLVAADQPVGEWVVPSATRPGDFRAQQVARVPATPATPADVALTPFYRTHRRTYSVYFDVLTPAGFEARAAAIAAERARLAKLAAATVAFVQPGEMQPERDFNYQSDPGDRPMQRINGRANRGGTGWFSFDLQVDPATEMAVVVTYFNEAGLSASGNFQILVDGTAIGRFQPNAVAAGFYDAQYAVPADLVRGKTKVTARFQASGNGRIAPVFGVRMIRATLMK